MYRGFELLRSLAASDTNLVVAGHDPEVMRRFPPVDGELAGLAVRIAPMTRDSQEPGTGPGRAGTAADGSGARR
jgi:hypothetical protein